MVGFPFGELVDLHLKCVELTKFFKNHHSHRAALLELQKQAKLRTLPLPGETRWGTISKNFIAVKDSERIIHNMLTNPAFVREGTAKQKRKKAEVKDIISHPDLLPLLEKAIELLKNIDKFIVQFQSDKTFLSDVYNCFDVLKNSFEADIFTPEERDWAKKVVADRFDFLGVPAHGMAARLDPRYRHCGNARLREEFDILVCEHSTDGLAVSEELQTRRYEELLEFDDYVQKMKEGNLLPWKALTRLPPTNIKKWWSTKGSMWPTLQSIALLLFSLVPSAASAERNFSTFGFVHSKLRNRLGADTVAKLVFIKQNSNYIKLLGGQAPVNRGGVAKAVTMEVDGDGDDDGEDVIHVIDSSDERSSEEEDESSDVEGRV